MARVGFPVPIARGFRAPKIQNLNLSVSDSRQSASSWSAASPATSGNGESSGMVLRSETWLNWGPDKPSTS